MAHHQRRKLIVGRHFGDEGQFLFLHRDQNPFQISSADQDFIHGENQPEVMFLVFNFEFGLKKLVERQQQAKFAGKFNAQSVRLESLAQHSGIFVLIF